MLPVIIILSIAIVAAIGFCVVSIIKLIMNWKEKETRNKNIIQLAVVITSIVILIGLNTFFIVKFSLDYIKTGLDNYTLPTLPDSVYKPLSDTPGAEILGTVEVNFSIIVSGDSESAKQQISHMAYMELLKAAKEKYSDTANLDIADVTWVFVNTNSIVLVTEMVEFQAVGKVIYGK